MRTITMRVDAHADGESYLEGETYEVSNALADHFVRRGYTVLEPGDESLLDDDVVEKLSADAGVGTDAEA